MRRILVVDDEAGVREFVAEALEGDDTQTLAVASGDNVFADGASLETPTTSGSVSAGYVAKLNVTI